LFSTKCIPPCFGAPDVLALSIPLVQLGRGFGSSDQKRPLRLVAESRPAVSIRISDKLNESYHMINV
jgi:hypothetical protein